MIRKTYRNEILMVLAAKLIGIYLLWSLFFSHPVSNALNAANLVKHYVTKTSSP